MDSITRVDVQQAYQLARKNGNELTLGMLARIGFTEDKANKVMNALVHGRLCAARVNKSTNAVVLQARDEETAVILKQLEEPEYKVFCAVESAGVTGAWTRDIASQTRLTAHKVQSVANNLSDMRGLIKPLKNIHQKNRKMYILASLEPSADVVGGSFYREGDFDHELVERLREQVMHVLYNRSQATYADIEEFVKGSGVAGSLGADDLKHVIRTLEMEQSVTKWMNAKEEAVYMVSRWPDKDVFSSIPCGSCPIAKDCLRGNGMAPVCPERCQYIDYWLSYDCTEYVHEPPKT